MPDLLDKGSTRLSSKRVHGRAINAVADLLRRNLSIPHIYLDPKIPGVRSADVLAVDRAGSGDLHAVEIKTVTLFRTREQLRLLLAEVMLLPFHFKYIALPGVLARDGPYKFAEYPELFNDDGIGRIGILTFDMAIVDASSGDGASTPQMLVRPERFRVQGKNLSAIERFLDKTPPDIAVRI